MKILIVSPYLPHPLCGQGGGVFIYGMVEHLMSRHQVTLVSFCDRDEQILSEDLKKMPIRCYFIPRDKGVQQQFVWNTYLVLFRIFQLIRSFLLWQPYYVSKYRHSKMARLIKKLTREELFDIVQIEFTQMGQYVRYVEQGKTFLHEIDVSFRPAYRRYKKSKSLMTKLMMMIEWCRWSIYERNIVEKFDHILSVTDQDRLLLRWLTGSNNISYFPHAYDVAEQVPDSNMKEPRSLVFLGSYSHQPNVDAVIWLCEDIFPRIAEQFPDAKLYVIGSKPPEILRSIAKKLPGIQLLGFVADFTPYLRKSIAFVAPMRFGGGVKNKVLVAMAQGLPVVTTKIGVEGIDGMDAETVAVGDTAPKIAEQVASLFNDPQRAARIGKKGWQVVREQYSWGSVISRLEHIYGKVLLS